MFEQFELVLLFFIPEFPNSSRGWAGQFGQDLRGCLNTQNSNWDLNIGHGDVHGCFRMTWQTEGSEGVHWSQHVTMIFSCVSMVVHTCFGPVQAWISHEICCHLGRFLRCWNEELRRVIQTHEIPFSKEQGPCDTTDGQRPGKQTAAAGAAAASSSGNVNRQNKNMKSAERRLGIRDDMPCDKHAKAAIEKFYEVFRGRSVFKTLVLSIAVAVFQSSRFTSWQHPGTRNGFWLQDFSLCGVI